MKLKQVEEKLKVLNNKELTLEDFILSFNNVFEEVFGEEPFEDYYIFKYTYINSFLFIFLFDEKLEEESLTNTDDISGESLIDFFIFYTSTIDEEGKFMWRLVKKEDKSILLHSFSEFCYVCDMVIQKDLH